MSATKAELDTIYESAIDRSNARKKKRRAAPLVRLWDGDWNLRGRLTGEYEASFEFKLNDTGQGRVVLPFDHHLARWVYRYWEREVQNVHITVDKDGARWDGRLDSCKLQSKTKDGLSTVELNFLSSYEELKHILTCGRIRSQWRLSSFQSQFILAGPSDLHAQDSPVSEPVPHPGQLCGDLPDDPLDFQRLVAGIELS
jgi:hypothetical protein